MSTTTIAQTEARRVAGQSRSVEPSIQDNSQKLNKRYRRLYGFFFRTTCHLIWWDVVLNRRSLRWLRTPSLPRWQRLAREYRILSTEMGGMLVKLGQLLSMRSDALPKPVIDELVQLQDQMPAEPFDAVVAQIEADLGGPISQAFAWFSPQPIAAASIAQAHLAHLQAEPGQTPQEVVVKVLRPGIDQIVDTDLAVITQFMRFLRFFKVIRQSVDLDMLAEEFSRVSRLELDLSLEGKNIERFGTDFAKDPQVYLPKIYWQYTRAHMLTLENVGYIKINDVETLEATGIQPLTVARQLAKIYIHQVFISHFIHADPHPGNLFVRPLPHPDEARDQPFALGETVPYHAERPFQLVLIDFGMATEVPEPARAWLREVLIGLGTRNAQRIIQAYVDGGVLRQDADLERLETMVETLLEHFQEALIGLVPDMRDEQTQRFIKQYEDLAFTPLFRAPTELLFMYRALGVVGSVLGYLDPKFELSTAVSPMVWELLWGELRNEVQDRLKAVTNLQQLLTTSPLQVDQLIFQTQKILTPPDAINQLMDSVRRKPDIAKAPPTAQEEMRQQLGHLGKRLTWVILSAMLLMAGVFWYVGLQFVSALSGQENQLDQFGFVLILLSLVAMFWGIRQERGS